MPTTTNSEIDRLLRVMARLRDPETGCPWDREQTFATIAPYTIEEAYEVADAIERQDYQGLREELGDLLLQVVYHAQMAKEAGRFAFADIARTIADKMIERHPHVFGDADDVETAHAQTQAWEARKAQERQARAETAGRRPSILDDLALALPALTRAEKLQKRAARIGFDWGAAGPVLDKIEEEIHELRHEINSKAAIHHIEDELGDLFFACVNLARHLGVDPELALRRGNSKFERRFRRLEALLDIEKRSAEQASLALLEEIWRRVKLDESGKNSH